MTAPWLKKFVEGGVEVTKVFKIVDASVGGGRWRVPTADELEQGIYYADGDEYQRAQRGEFTYIPKESQNGSASA